MRIHFVRHGESQANAFHVIANRDQPYPLTPLGEQQARDLAERLAGEPVTRVLHSPILRAVQTAQILAARLNAPIEAADALREPDCGVLEGRSDAESWAQHMALLRAWLLDHRWDQRLEGGESLLEMRDRFVPLLETLCRQYGPGNGDLVLVGHSALYACLLPLVMDNVDHSFAWSHPLKKAGQVVANWTDPCLHCLDWDGVVLDSGGTA
ncbi:MAG: histidine phosphatase family protein [Chloroflexota bacterium]|nr:histidine phosphatase family protein [Chloroflexota bacterium]